MAEGGVAGAEAGRLRSTALSFLHFLGAHKFYLGKGREARRLILLYFLAPLAAVVCLILVMQIFLGIELPRIAGPKKICITRSRDNPT